MPFKPNALDQTCAARRTLDLIADKWAVLLIYALADGTKRYSDLHRMVEGITPKMLAQTLRRLEISGLINRKVYPVVPPRVEYALTPLGKTLIIPLTALCRWSEEHSLEVETLQRSLSFIEGSKAEL
jgi:DNA-binding HxlR family transcriptional regulator